MDKHLMKMSAQGGVFTLEFNNVSNRIIVNIKLVVIRDYYN